ncbi:MAG: YtxH domain-containing protein [Coriobacteriia bacterium]|nr:YtxH domain-containing protein [Coriobacteriia bacterium]
MNKRLEYFVIGILVGGVAGVIIGLLFAPDAGSRTRRRLVEEATRVAEAARGVAERAEHAVEVLGSKMDHYLGRDEEVAWRKVHEIRQGVHRYSGTVVSS